MIEPIRWEDEFPRVAVHAYKQVKLALMKRAYLAKIHLAERLGVPLGYKGRDYLYTNHGLYRVAMNYNSDNNIERAALDDMNVETIHVDNPEEMIMFFHIHGMNGENEYENLRQALKENYENNS